MQPNPAWFEQRSEPEPNTGCWLWLRARNRNGYGIASISGVKTGIAHRMSYEALMGAIPDGMQLDHLCRNKACINPTHLEPVTNAENARRRRRVNCKYGHEMVTKTVRVCVTCNVSRSRSWRQTEHVHA